MCVKRVMKVVVCVSKSGGRLFFKKSGAAEKQTVPPPPLLLPYFSSGERASERKRGPQPEPHAPERTLARHSPRSRSRSHLHTKLANFGAECLSFEGAARPSPAPGRRRQPSRGLAGGGGEGSARENRMFCLSSLFLSLSLSCGVCVAEWVAPTLESTRPRRIGRRPAVTRSTILLFLRSMKKRRMTAKSCRPLFRRRRRPPSCS